MRLTSFIHQKSYEHIERKVRRHPIILIPALAFLFLLLPIPALAFYLVISVYESLLSSPGLMLVTILIGSIYYLSIGIFYYTYFVTFYLDLLIITNDRLLHIEQMGLFTRSVSEVDLYKIQDVTSTIDGFFPSMFGYGELMIQTSGAMEKFIINNIPDPESLRQKILDLAEEDRKFHLASK